MAANKPPRENQLTVATPTDSPATLVPAVQGAGVRAGLPRWVEVPFAFAVLVTTSPIIAIAALLILLTSRGPVLFRQARVGRGGRPFVMLKLRTMRPSSHGPQVTAGSDARITTAGRLLRRLKLDELPELWNVVRGDMALVGPRPEVSRYVRPADPLWQEVLTVRPGLTDPVTLRLRNEEELLARVGGDHEQFYVGSLLPFKLRGYVGYLRARTWWSDVVVLAKTALAIVRLGDPPPTLEEINAKPEDASIAP